MSVQKTPEADVRRRRPLYAEVGMIVALVAVIAAFTVAMIPLVSLVFHCRATGGELTPHPLECTDVGWFAEDALPDPTAGADLWAAHAFAAIRGEDVPVLFDLPRTPPWKGAPDHLEGLS